MAASISEEGLVPEDIGEKPHQPLTFNFPKRSFGKKTIVQRSFQPAWFTKWPFIHYDEAKDAAFCHTCLLAINSKRMRTRSLDPAFVSAY